MVLSTQLLRVMMNKREVVLVAVIGLQLLALLGVLYQRSSNVNLTPNAGVQEMSIPHSDVEASPSAASRFKEERNLLSRELNHVKQEYAKRSCEMMEMRGKLENRNAADQRLLKVSESGGWCLNASKADGGEHIIDSAMATQLSNFLAGKYVASFGDGPGEYKRVIDQTGKLKAYDAYDGAPYCAEVSQNRVKFLDLTAPQYGLPLYDWIVSLEVAEHIPNKYEAVFLDNIVRHAREGVILSWAVPGQGGLAHINNQPFSHVEEVFKSRGFSHDSAVSQQFQNTATAPWLKSNTNVFRRTGAEAREDEA